MENRLFREKIVKEYVDNRKPEKRTDEVWSVEEYIKFYEDNKKSLKSLFLDINEYFVDHKNEMKNVSNLTTRQIGCLQRITKCFSESVYEDNAMNFSQACYEMLDFVYTPGYDYDELSYNEIEIIKMMISFLNSKADELIKKLENNKYLDKYRLQKSKETLKRKYYNLIVDNKVVGNGWISKKEYKLLFKKGMDIFIEPQYRRKKYGTKFYDLLSCEISSMDITGIYLVVDKEDKIAIEFLNKQINPHERRMIIGNKMIFEDTLIIVD